MRGGNSAFNNQIRHLPVLQVKAQSDNKLGMHGIADAAWEWNNSCSVFVLSNMPLEGLTPETSPVPVIHRTGCNSSEGNNQEENLSSSNQITASFTCVLLMFLCDIVVSFAHTGLG